MWINFFAALALVLVIEGIFPFICPDCWRSTVKKISEVDDKSLRMFGFICMFLGALLLSVIHAFFY